MSNPENLQVLVFKPTTTNRYELVPVDKLDKKEIIINGDGTWAPLVRMPGENNHYIIGEGFRFPENVTEAFVLGVLDLNNSGHHSNFIKHMNKIKDEEMKKDIERQRAEKI